MPAAATPTQKSIRWGDILSRPTNGQSRRNVTQDIDMPNVQAPVRPDTPESQPKVTSTPMRTVQQVTYEIADTEFIVTQDEGFILVEHPLWSLMGRGGTLAEAEIDLILNARDQAAVYLNHPPHRMAKSAVDLRDFILRVL